MQASAYQAKKKPHRYFDAVFKMDKKRKDAPAATGIMFATVLFTSEYFRSFNKNGYWPRGSKK